MCRLIFRLQVWALWGETDTPSRSISFRHWCTIKVWLWPPPIPSLLRVIGHEVGGITMESMDLQDFILWLGQHIRVAILLKIH